MSNETYGKVPLWVKVVALAGIVSVALAGSHYYFNIFLPQHSDSDKDGLSDWDEVNVHHTDPRNPDTDGDGLWDGSEVSTYKTNPLIADTDGDGLPDGLEVSKLQTDPSKPNPNIAYALSKNIPPDVSIKLLALDKDGEMDENEKSLVDYLPSLSPEYQSKTVEQILADEKVSSEESETLKYLSKYPLPTNQRYIDLGLDGDVIKYLLFTSSLQDKKFAEYAVNNMLCIQDKKLTELETKFIKEFEKYSKTLLDTYAKEGGEIYPGLSREIMKLPDLKTIDEKDIEAVEDIITLASEPKYKEAFIAMLKEGIPEKRKYCTPLEALLWILYDKEPDDPTLKNIISNPIELVEYAWRYSSESKNYASERWKNFDEVVDRLNSPNLVSIFTGYNIRYKSETVNEYVPAWIVYERKYDDCDGFATFQAYCLKANGYDAWNIGIAIDTPIGHNVCGYSDKGNWYVLDVSGIKRGPFKSIDNLADEVGGLCGIPKGSSIYLIDPFTITSPVFFPSNYIIYRR